MLEYNIDEAKTNEFFSQDYKQLADALREKVIVKYEDDPKKRRAVVIKATRGWGIKDNKRDPYQIIQTMQPGHLSSVEYKFRKSRLSLISALEDGKPGACIEVEKAGRFQLDLADPEKSGFVDMPRKRDMADFMEIPDNKITRLAFLNEPSGSLYLLESAARISLPTVSNLNPERANELLLQILGLGDS